MSKKSKIQIPPETPANAPRMADSMQTAAGVMGVEVGLLQFVKRKGSPGFTGSGRVDTEAVQAWMDANPEIVNSRPSISKEEIDIKLKVLKFERDTQSKEREKFQFDVERGKYWKKEEVAAEIRLIAAHRKAILQRKLETELPPKLLGKNVIEITEAMTAVVDEICQLFHDRTRKYL